MRPGLALKNALNLRLGDAEFSGDFTLEYTTGRVTSANSQHAVGGEFGGSDYLTARHALGMLTSTITITASETLRSGP